MTSQWRRPLRAGMIGDWAGRQS